jgi:hypothetical protein
VAGATGGAAPADDYAPLAELGGGGGDGGFSVKSPGAVQVSGLGIRGSVDSGRNRGLFLEDAPAAYAALLQAEMHTDAPALADVDGDGQKDIVFFDGRTLRIHLAKAGFASTPSRVESVPDWLDPGDGGLLLHLRDLDGDGDVDAYARVAPKQGGIEHGTFTYFVMRNDGSRIFPEQPQQVLRFEGNGTDSELTDVDGDGRLDLVVTKYELPSLTDLAGGFKLTRSAMVYFASDGDEPFERKPAIKDEQLFTIDSLQDALVDRHISGDFSGDGLADLVEVDLTGRVVIRRVTSEHHFLRRRRVEGRGDALEAARPRLEPQGPAAAGRQRRRPRRPDQPRHRQPDAAALAPDGRRAMRTRAAGGRSRAWRWRAWRSGRARARARRQPRRRRPRARARRPRAATS